MDIETDEIQLEKDFFYLLSLKRPFLTRRLYHAVMEALEGVRLNVERYKEDNIKPVVKKEITGIIHFELHELKGRWFPIIRSIGKDENPYKIIPQVLIDYIADRAGENVIPWKNTPLDIPGFENPLYVSFSKERDDSSVITGTIEPADDLLNEAETLTDNIENNQDELRPFLEHLFKYPEFYKSVMRDFRLKWKPLLEMVDQEKDNVNAV